MQPTPNVIIRDARPEDAPGVSRVHTGSWLTTYRGILPDAVLDGLSVEEGTCKWERTIAKVTPPRFLLVAEVEGEVVGFADGGRCRDEDAPGQGEVYAVYLLQSHHRRGIGRQLMVEAGRRLLAAGLAPVRVWVFEANSSTTFYEALGGRRMQRRLLAIYGVEVPEVAYEWSDPRILIDRATSS